MRLSHNMPSLNIFNEQTKILQKQSSSLGRITSGVKLNSAKDNPNTLAQHEKFQMQIRGLEMAQRNTQDGASMLQTTDGGLGEITTMLQRIKELVVQAGSAADSVENKATIKNEISQLSKGINDISNTTNFNGVNLLNHEGSMQSVVGANANEVITIPSFNVVSSNLKNATGNKSLDDISFDTPQDLLDAQDIADNSLTTVLNIRSKLGAIENRFESSQQSLSDISSQMQEADSQISDTDVAAEIVEYSKDNILIEAGNAMLAQTNKLPQDVLNILNKK